MADFAEANFYDGTLNTNLTLQQAHTNLTVMMKDIEKCANKARDLPGSSLSVSGGGGGGVGGTVMERRRAGRRQRGRAGSQSSSLMKDVESGKYTNKLEPMSNGGSSNSSGYGSGMGMISEEGQDSPSLLNMLDPAPAKAGSSSLMDMFGSEDDSGPNLIEVMNDGEEGSLDAEVQIQGVGAMDLFIDEANPLNKAVHAALPTVAKKLENHRITEVSRRDRNNRVE